MEQQLQFEGDVNEAGEPHGKWVANFPDGSIQAEIHFYKGKRQGETNSWHENGERAGLETYQQDVLHGPIEYWNEHGKPTLQGEYLNGIKHGRWKMWAPNGKQTLDATYQHGKAHGVQRQYLPWRVEPIEQNYCHGVLVDTDFRRPLEPPAGWFYWLSMVCLFAAAAMVWWQAPMVIYGIFGIGLAIAVHELGHWWVARWVGIPVKSFSVGIGWRLLSFYWGGTLFHLRLIPLMGYIETYQLKRGEFERWNWRRQHQDKPFPDSLTPIDPDESDRGADSFAVWWKRLAFYAGGLAINLLLAIGVLWICFWPEQPDRAIQATAITCGELWSALPMAVGKQFRAEKEGLQPTDFLHELTTALGGPEVELSPEASDSSSPSVNQPPTLPIMAHFAILNLILFTFNALPIPNLDGFNMLVALVEGAISRPLPMVVMLPLRIVGAIIIAALVLGGIFFLGLDIFNTLVRPA